jgi:hypothetical protein
MTNLVTTDLRHQFRSATLFVLLVFLGCGGGSAPVTQHEGTTSPDAPADVPPAEATQPAACTPAELPQTPQIALGQVDANPGARIFVDVMLTTANQQIAGVQADISFPSGTHVAARPNGRPDCEVNPDINKTASSFAFVPNLCPDGSCSELRAIVWAVDNVDPIMNGARLFSCAVMVDVDAAGSLTLTGGNVVMSDPSGQRIDGVATDGIVTVSSTPLPTSTPAVVITQPAVILDAFSAQPGQIVDLSIRLATTGSLIAGVQFDLNFPPQARVDARDNGRPFCFVNPDIEKNGTAFGFLPAGCVGSECTTLRAIVLSLATVDPIPDGSVLVSCQVSITGDAHGAYQFVLNNVVASDPNGQYISGLGIAGTVDVVGTPVPTAVPSTPVPTATPTSTAPPPPSPIATATGGPAVSHAAIVLPAISAPAGAVVPFEVVLVRPDDEVISGAQNDIDFPAGARVAATLDGKPDCRANPDIQKESTGFAFRPFPCSGECTGMRAIVVSVVSQDPIPSHSVLYTCRLEIASTAAGTLPLATTNVVMSDPFGNRIPDAEGRDGAVVVSAP